MAFEQIAETNGNDNQNQYQPLNNSHPDIKQKIYNIKKSENDQREYCFFVLSNELRILLVSDKTTEKAAASVDVHIGNDADPVDVPGIAHFCEHMLFLGTHKYPIENGFLDFLSQNGGSSNACTLTQHTNYHFDVKADQFEQALDRFAQFFICPLFNKDSTDRELNAINSEFQKNILNDVYRISYLDKQTSKPGHAYTKFSCGNLETLKTIPTEKNIDIRDMLLTFHEHYYSANIMTLAIVGRESLNDLEKMVVSKFKDVKNKNIILSYNYEHPYGKEELGLRFDVATIKEDQTLELRFPIPDMHDHYESKPDYYVSWLVGHEGRGSLLSLLKQKAWVQTLNSGSSSTTERGFQFFIIKMSLTEDGLNHITDIIMTVFQYINLLKSENAHEWIYQEMKMMSEVKFKFKDIECPRSYVRELSFLMQLYPPDDILYGSYAMNKFCPDLIKIFINLLTPDKFRYFVGSKSFTGMTLLKGNYYNTEYNVTKISADQIKEWETCGLNPELHLPDKNPFIPDSLKIKVTKKEPKSVPYIIKDTEMMRIWFKADDTYLLPKAIISIAIKSPIANGTPLDSNLLGMFFGLVNDELNELLYNAELANLHCSLLQSSSGILIFIYGYDNKQHLLLSTILQKLTNLEIKEDRFNTIKELREKSLRNYELNEPYQQITSCSVYLTQEATWDVDDRLACMKDVTVTTLEEYKSRFLRSLFVECLLFGNLLQDNVNEVVRVIDEELLASARPLFPLQHMLPRTYCLKEGLNYLFEKRSKIHFTSCVQIVLQVGVQETKINVLCELIASILSEPFFNQLRTKDQLGYIVSCGVCKSNTTQGIQFLVQSDKEPAYVENRIGDFLIDFEQTILNMSPSVFSSYVQSLIEKKLEKPKRLRQEYLQYSSEINSKQYHFKRGEVEAEALRNVTQEETLLFYKRHICPRSDARKAITVVILGKDAQSILEGPGNKSWILVDDVLRFKSELGLYPLVYPYNNEVKLLATTTKSKL